jgi:hypothetical protein
MKITKTQLHKIIKEVVTEVSGKQRAHDERVAAQKEQRAQKEADAEELRQTLGGDWEINVRFLEDRYQITAHRQTWGRQAGPTDFRE